MEKGLPKMLTRPVVIWCRVGFEGHQGSDLRVVRIQI